MSVPDHVLKGGDDKSGTSINKEGSQDNKSCNLSLSGVQLNNKNM